MGCQRLGRNPLDSVTLQRFWLSLQEGATENMKRYASIAVTVVDREAMTFYPDLNAEFLGQFSLKTFFK